jgi:hypothetical protein
MRGGRDRWRGAVILGGYFAALATSLAATAVTGLAVWVGTAFVDGMGFCPDGGDEIWTHPGPAAYLPVLGVGLGLTAFATIVMWTQLRSAEAVHPGITAILLGGLSVGGTALYITGAAYLSHWGEPDRFRCAARFAGKRMP